MKPIKTKESNHVFQPPVGMEETVNPLNVQMLENEGMPLIRSFWKLEPGDIENIIISGGVYLDIAGHGMPPVIVFTHPENPET